MTDLLDDMQQQITRRLAELKPLVAEHHRLEAAAAALEGIPPTPSGVSVTSTRPRSRRGPGRPRGSKTAAITASTPASPKPASTAIKPTAKRKRRRRKRTGKRATQALALIRAEPGITIPRLAETMGIYGNYLYKVLPPLEQAGKIRKDGRGWHPKQA